MKQIINVFPKDNFRIIATFSDGARKEFDVGLLIKKYKPFEAMLIDKNLFYSAKIAEGGYAIKWNDELDISSNSVYYEGKDA